VTPWHRRSWNLRAVHRCQRTGNLFELLPFGVHAEKYAHQTSENHAQRTNQIADEEPECIVTGADEDAEQDGSDGLEGLCDGEEYGDGFGPGSTPFRVLAPPWCATDSTAGDQGVRVSDCVPFRPELRRSLSSCPSVWLSVRLTGLAGNLARFRIG
jgi:hypothetical protein